MYEALETAIGHPGSYWFSDETCGEPPQQYGARRAPIIEPDKGRALDTIGVNAMSASNDNRRTWTPDAVRELGLTTDLPTAAQIIGIGRSLAYDLAKAGQFPVRILRIRGRVLVPVPDLLRYVGASPEHDDGNGHST